MANATQRRDAILELVREEPVGSQEALLALLRRRGFRVTQPTLSRDIKELGLARTPAGYVAASDLGSVSPFAPKQRREEKLAQAVREFLLEVIPSGTLAILRTPPAGAQPLARAVDEAGLDGVIGTIAGDDAVFVATRNAAVARGLSRQLERLLTPLRARRIRA